MKTFEQDIFDQLPVAVVDQIVRQQEEIEQLRAEIKQLDEANKFLLKSCSEMEEERDRLRIGWESVARREEEQTTEIDRLRDIIQREAWLEEARAEGKPGPYISFDEYDRLRELLRSAREPVQFSYGEWLDPETKELLDRIDAALGGLK